MTLMSDIVKDVLVELRFGAGQDVQIHLQEGIVANVSRLYRTLMRKYVWRDYTSTSSHVVDAATGQVTDNIAPIVTRFSNILAIFLEESTVPLPVAPIRSNPAQIKSAVVVATAGPKLFTIWPKKDRNIVMITRLYSEDDFDMEDDVPFYRDVLALGAAYQLSMKAGTNDQLTQSLKQQFEQLLDTHVTGEMQDNYQVAPYRGTFPTEWFVDGQS